MRDSKSEPTTAVVMLKDITELKREDDALKQYSELGLTVTKTLVKNPGGSIEVQSELGNGTTFTVRQSIVNREGR